MSECESGTGRFVVDPKNKKPIPIEYAKNLNKLVKVRASVRACVRVCAYVWNSD